MSNEPKPRVEGHPGLAHLRLKNDDLPRPPKPDLSPARKKRNVVYAVILGVMMVSALLIPGKPSDYDICVQRGIAYYKEIGSFPRFKSTGQDAEQEVRMRCGRTRGAFGPITRS